MRNYFFGSIVTIITIINILGFGNASEVLTSIDKKSKLLNYDQTNLQYVGSSHFVLIIMIKILSPISCPAYCVADKTSPKSKPIDEMMAMTTLD